MIHHLPLSFCHAFFAGSMDLFHSRAEVLALGSALLLLLMRSNSALAVVTADEEDEEYFSEFNRIRQGRDTPSVNANLVTSAALNSFRLCTSVHVLGDDLGFWVKPRSTTWFSRFLLEQYDKDR